MFIKYLNLFNVLTIYVGILGWTIHSANSSNFYDFADIPGSSEGADEEDVKIPEQMQNDMPVILESGDNEPDSPTDAEPYLVEYTPIAAKLSKMICC